MDLFDPSLLDTRLGDFKPDVTFNASLNVQGTYDGLRFVVRLSPRVHDLINELPDGIQFSRNANFEQMQAFSTYLHETIHWWQHVGSTSGFLISLNHAAQTHSNLTHLRKILDLVGPVKSIFQLAKTLRGPVAPNNAAGLANIIVNNQFDIEAYRFLVTNPERAQEIVQSPLFENMAHAYRVAQANAVLTLATTFDRDFDLLPDPKKWIGEYHKLRKAKEEGFFYGSPVTLSPIGAKFIFEGQARFLQMQYLYFSTGGRFDFNQAKILGMLSPLYMTAFEAFLSQSGLDYPPTIDHPTFGLFLVVCDIAMNPGEGFPFPVWSAHSSSVTTTSACAFCN